MCILQLERLQSIMCSVKGRVENLPKVDQKIVSFHRKTTQNSTKNQINGAVTASFRTPPRSEHVAGQRFGKEQHRIGPQIIRPVRPTSQMACNDVDDDSRR